MGAFILLMLIQQPVDSVSAITQEYSSYESCMEAGRSASSEFKNGLFIKVFYTCTAK